MNPARVTILDPLKPSGTPVYDVTAGVDKKEQLGVSVEWSTRWRPSHKGEGCVSWIDHIVVAKDSTTANSTPVHAPGPAVASSSFSSRHVVAILLDQDGNEDARKTYPYVYVVDFHPSGRPDRNTGKDVPIADELWFSQTPVTHPNITKAENACTSLL